MVLYKPEATHYATKTKNPFDVSNIWEGYL